ncbi:MAG TPA: DNA topoisomerase IV subunit A [Spirochaetia bacterium]|nr:DNA topoisomerase IV subunit A [Spirochaetia bacterium]
MAYVTKLFNTNFLEYASYVIKDRAIPHVDDGLKPVQRRIIHSLFEMDDGKFHKVANVTGHCMKYHPHGDASIYSALVVIANRELFIDRQGNFGNIFTGDEPAAARYIECRITPLAKKVFYNPEITEYEDSYDGRNREPVTFPAKIPVVLIQGAEGIAVGMSTKILPHNFSEVLSAVSACLRGEKFTLYPDFPTGGLVDVSDYQDGNGKVLVRAKLDTKDPKKIVIREIPFGSTTESLIASIEAAAKKNKIKISGISDFTTENVEIEIALARGVYSQETVDALFAFTDCEMSIPVNLLVIREGRPVTMTITGIIEYHAKRLVEILTAELKFEERTLRDRLHAKTLEQIFIENRIYKAIEEMDTQEKVVRAVRKGLAPYASQIRRDVTDDDIERLLKIPIRRISLYDINKAKQEMKEIKTRLKEISYNLQHITDFAISFLEGLSKEYGKSWERRTKITSFERVDVREAAQRNLELRYDGETGYLGWEIKSGKLLFNVSEFDRVLVVRRSGVYSVIDAPEKLFVDKGMLACGLAEKETLANIVFTVIYRNSETHHAFIKRCRIEQYILDKGYLLVPEGNEVMKLTTEKEGEVKVSYKAGPRTKVREESFEFKDFPVRGQKTLGVRLGTKEVDKVSISKPKTKAAKAAVTGTTVKSTKSAGAKGTTAKKSASASKSTAAAKKSATAKKAAPKSSAAKKTTGKAAAVKKTAAKASTAKKAPAKKAAVKKAPAKKPSTKK